MTGVAVVSNNGCMGGERGERGEREMRKEPNFKRERPEMNRAPKQSEKGNEQQISVIALLIAALRKSVVACRLDDRQDDDVALITGMEISWPMDVRHVAHVTFDRFNGFLGLPVEFEMEVPSRAPSARCEFLFKIFFTFLFCISRESEAFYLLEVFFEGTWILGCSVEGRR
jgi:P21-Rho-binding domain